MLKTCAIILVPRIPLQDQNKDLTKGGESFPTRVAVPMVVLGAAALLVFAFIHADDQSRPLLL